MAKYTRRRTGTRKAAASSKRCGRNKTKKSSVSRRRRAQHGGKWPFGKKPAATPVATPVATEGTGIRIGVGNLAGSNPVIPRSGPVPRKLTYLEEAQQRRAASNAADKLRKNAAEAAEREQQAAKRLIEEEYNAKLSKLGYGPRHLDEKAKMWVDAEILLQEKEEQRRHDWEVKWATMTPNAQKAYVKQQEDYVKQQEDIKKAKEAAEYDRNQRQREINGPNYEERERLRRLAFDFY